jgi:aspartate kinase
MQHSAVSFSVCFNGDEEKLESLIEALKDTFSLRYNTGLTLITVRHYNEEIIDQLTGGKKIYLEQKSRSTIQILVK